MKQITFWGNKNVIGEQIASIRQKKNMSQSELAAKMQLLNINIDQQMISKIEKNQRQVTDYEFIGFSLCLNVSLNELIGDFKNKFIQGSIN